MSDRYNHWLPRLIAKIKGTKTMAITLGATCTIWSESEEYVRADFKWKAHEFQHRFSIRKRQLEKGKYYGWIDWMATYLWRMITVGYYNSEEEKDARDAANR